MISFKSGQRQESSQRTKTENFKPTLILSSRRRNGNMGWISTTKTFWWPSHFCFSWHRPQFWDYGCILTRCVSMLFHTMVNEVSYVLTHGERHTFSRLVVSWNSLLANLNTMELLLLTDIEKPVGWNWRKQENASQFSIIVIITY